jgi:hypothetical protein
MSLVAPGMARRVVKNSSARNSSRKKICEILRHRGNLDRITNRPPDTHGHWQGSEQDDALKGTSFSPYIKPAKSTRALAPEGMLRFPRNLLRTPFAMPDESLAYGEPPDSDPRHRLANSVKM